MALDLALDEGLDGDATSVDGARTRTDRAPAPSPWSRRTILLTFAALLVLTVALRLPAFFVEVFNSDETFLATQAEVINEGGRLYEDAADRKPPIVPYLYAAAFNAFLRTSSSCWRAGGGRRCSRSPSPWSLLAVEARRVRRPRPVRVVLVFCRARLGGLRASRRPGRQFRGLHAAGDDRGGPARRAWLNVRLSGVAVVIATLAKQTGAATMLPVLYLAWRHLSRRRRGRCRRRRVS